VAIGVDPTADPLASLPTPIRDDFTVRATSKTTLTGVATLLPGVYQDGIHISGTAAVIMEEGVYYVEGGGFQVTGNGSLAADGVLIFNTAGNGFGADKVSIAGNGSIDWSPPSSGPWNGIAVFQERSDGASKVQITGNGNTRITGTVYARDAEAAITGNGVGDILGGAFVAARLVVAGNGQFSVTGAAVVGGGSVAVFLVE
jgi:hypothetical protein